MKPFQFMLSAKGKYAEALEAHRFYYLYKVIIGACDAESIVQRERDNYLLILQKEKERGKVKPMFVVFRGHRNKDLRLTLTLFIDYIVSKVMKTVN